MRAFAQAFLICMLLCCFLSAPAQAAQPPAQGGQAAPVGGAPAKQSQAAALADKTQSPLSGAEPQEQAPARAGNPPDGFDEDALAEAFDKAMEEPAYYMAQGDGFKAADALARQIRLAAAQGGEYGPLALRLKWMFCLLSIDGGHPEAAFALAGENLPGIIKTYGEHAAETANFKSTRLFAASAMSDGKSAATAAVDVLPLYTEQRQPLEQSTILFNWMSAALSMGEKEKAAFLAKLSAGMISYARAEDDSMSAYVPFPDFGALADDFASLGIKLDKTALAQLSAAPNAPGDTAYNKARTLMSGPEAALYKQYGQCAAALNMAGADGTNAQKEAARNAFKDWLAQVDKTWPAKQQRE